MGDLYQHTAATQISNQLGQHSLDMNEANLNAYTNKKLLYAQKVSQDQTKASSDLRGDAESDLPALPVVAKTTVTGLKAGRAFGVGTYRGVSQAEGVVDSVKGVGRGLSGAKRVLSVAGDKAGAQIFGEGSVAVKDMTGVEGIVGKNLVEAGAGEAFAKIGAKGIAGAGALFQGGSDAYNMFETGSIFNTKNADGSISKGTTGEDVANVATLIAGGADLLAAFTGGALAPIAAAANIAAAGLSTYETAKADDAAKATDSADTPPSQPPPVKAAPAFAQLGIVSNQNHNPLSHIS